MTAAGSGSAGSGSAGSGSAGFVRAARASDAPGLARIQVESWLGSLRGLVPDPVLEQLSSPEATEQFTEQWREAITNPPSSRHRVHVATGAPGSAAEPVGFAAAGPATDEDKWPGTDAQLYELHSTDPEHGTSGQHGASGHRARLLHAVADTLAEDDFRTVCTWALADDTAWVEFLESAGWAPDGARSNLDMGVKVPVMRLHTRLSPATSEISG